MSKGASNAAWARAFEESEQAMDHLLGIRTTGRDESHASLDCNPYEPTPYGVLERLANSGHLRKGNCLIDYGCGKGRVGFFLSYHTRCASLGVEVDQWLYEGALRNKARAVSGRRTRFVQADARTFVPPDEVDRFYLFNPFSAEVFAKVLHCMAQSLDRSPRPAQLFLYYPDESYSSVLREANLFTYRETIDCRDLFPNEDPRERIDLWEIPAIHHQ